MLSRTKTSLLCMTTNRIAPIVWPRPLLKYFLHMCVSNNATSLSVDAAAAETEQELRIIAQVRVLARGEWVAFRPHSVLFISLFFHILLLSYWVTRGLWKIWLSDALRSWTQTSRTAGRCVMTAGRSTLRPQNRTAAGLWLVDPQNPLRFIVIRPSLTLEGPYQGTSKRLEHLIWNSCIWLCLHVAWRNINTYI